MNQKVCKTAFLGVLLFQKLIRTLICRDVASLVERKEGEEKASTFSFIQRPFYYGWKVNTGHISVELSYL